MHFDAVEPCFFRPLRALNKMQYDIFDFISGKPLSDFVPEVFNR